MSNATPWWDIELESKPDFNQAMKRIYAWYEQAIIDRPPVRFTGHNAEFEEADGVWKPQWGDLKHKWFDEEYQLEKFMTQVRGKRYQDGPSRCFCPTWDRRSPLHSTAVRSFFQKPPRGRCPSSWTTARGSRSTGTTHT